MQLLRCTFGGNDSFFLYLNHLPRTAVYVSPFLRMKLRLYLFRTHYQVVSTYEVHTEHPVVVVVVAVQRNRYLHTVTCKGWESEMDIVQKRRDRDLKKVRCTWKNCSMCPLVHVFLKILFGYNFNATIIFDEVWSEETSKWFELTFRLASCFKDF